MPPLTAIPSTGREQPSESGDPQLTAASPTETEASGSTAGASLDAAALPGSDSPAPPSGEQQPSDQGIENKEAVSANTGSDPQPAADNGMEHFQRLRRRLLLATVIATAATVPLCWLLFDAATALSLLVGALCGLLYLLLLARSVARIGGDRRSVGKIQLLVPVVLVLASSRLPQLELVPALVGFLLYKPALLVQAYLDR